MPDKEDRAVELLRKVMNIANFCDVIAEDHVLETKTLECRSCGARDYLFKCNYMKHKPDCVFKQAMDFLHSDDIVEEEVKIVETCPHCFKPVTDCDCCDADANPEMGAQR